MPIQQPVFCKRQKSLFLSMFYAMTFGIFCAAAGQTQGFRPHTARVFRCRVSGGRLRPSEETPRVAWFPTGALPSTLLPWFRGPLLDAMLESSRPVERLEHQGLGAILAGLRIDLGTRWRGV